MLGRFFIALALLLSQLLFKRQQRSLFIFSIATKLAGLAIFSTDQTHLFCVQWL